MKLNAASFDQVLLFLFDCKVDEIGPTSTAVVKIRKCDRHKNHDRKTRTVSAKLRCNIRVQTVGQETSYVRVSISVRVWRLNDFLCEV